MKKGLFVFMFCSIQLIGFAQTGTRARSAKSGQYVTKSYAKSNPSTTVVEKSRTKSSSNNVGTARRRK